jgi:hypothetical protein
MIAMCLWQCQMSCKIKEKTNIFPANHFNNTVYEDLALFEIHPNQI